MNEYQKDLYEVIYIWRLHVLLFFLLQSLSRPNKSRNKNENKIRKHLHVKLLTYSYNIM